MMLTINGKKILPSEFQNGKIAEKNYSEFQKRAIELINSWHSNQEIFSFETSGSTGKRRKVEIPRAIIEYSAKSTLQKIDPKGVFRKSLVCINPFYIGGAMALFRALIAGYELVIIDPHSNPFAEIEEKQFDLISMVPLQVQTILDSDPSLFSRVNTVLIGGASLSTGYLDKLKECTQTRFFHSFGMTETASHFALKDLHKSAYFETVGDIELDCDSRGSLKVKGALTNGLWLQTNDLVDILDATHFRWLGRVDNVINTGGVKVFPEEIESLLDVQIKEPYFVTGIPDERLGESVILVIQTSKEYSVQDLDFGSLAKYSVPKSIHTMDQFIYTQTGKLDRPETLKLLQIEN